MSQIWYSFGMFVKSLAHSCMHYFIQTPVHTIASNAGVEGAVVVGKLLEQDNPDLGYDAAKGQYYNIYCLHEKTREIEQPMFSMSW